MIVKFQARFNGDLWCALAEGADIYVIGESIVELMKNVDTAARMHFSGKLRPGEDLHILVANTALVSVSPPG